MMQNTEGEPIGLLHDYVGGGPGTGASAKLYAGFQFVQGKMLSRQTNLKGSVSV